MDIAFFTDTYLPNVDGVVRTLVDLRHQMQAHRNRVYIFTAGSQAAARKVNDPHVFYHRSLTFPLYPQYKVAVFPYLTAINQARKHGVQVVHSHAMTPTMGLAAISTSKALKLPLVGTFHTMLPNAMHLVTWNKASSKAASKMMWRALEALYSPFDVMTAPSHCVANAMEEHGIKNVRVIPNGVDPKRFKPDRAAGLAERKRLGIPANSPIVLVAGRLSPEKNVPVIVKAAKEVVREIPGATFIITGEGPAKKEVERLVKASGLSRNIRLVGFLPDGQMQSLYCAADVLATASTFETQGLSALEALSCGTPVVGADAMAIPEAVFEGRNGYLFRAQDSGDCSEKLIKVLGASEKEGARLSRNARATGVKFAISKSAGLYLDLYHQLT